MINQPNARQYSSPHRDFAGLMHEVVLVNMPFSNLFTPSLGLGLLQAGLKRNGVSCRTLDLHLFFAEAIGQGAYRTIESDTYPEHLVGEWIFSESLFHAPQNVDLELFVREVLAAPTVDDPDQPIYGAGFLAELRPAMVLARTRVERFLEECVETVLAHRPRLVGFTSMFQQHVASLSLAKRIKERAPECVVVFGGSNCEGAMGAETFRQFGFVDLLVSGEADEVLPVIVDAVLSGNRVPAIAGVYDRQRPALRVSGQSAKNTPAVSCLDPLPFPDYDDYFVQLRSTSLTPNHKPNLLFESSRGCWWGEKMHCTFCGLNGATMTYRSKSAERALEELIYLKNRYPGCGLNAVDNILDMKYFKTLVKMLAEGDYDFGLFYEVKANLRKDQLRSLKAAGIKTIQPGIESLSDNVLRIMKKGVSALQNIQLLKWCNELDLKVIYNIIWGFPGESVEDFQDTIDLIPLITHLRPPVGSGTIRIDRFSPNFDRSRELGFGEMHPFPAYHFVYPFDDAAVTELAYYFVPEPVYGIAPTLDTRGLSKQIRSWRESYLHSELFFFDRGSKLLVWDMRPLATEPLFVLDEFARQAYLACDEARSRSQLSDFWRANSSLPWNEVRLTDTLDFFVDRSLMIHTGEQYLSLAYQRSA